MVNKPDPTDVKSIWQNQSVEGTTMSLDEIRRRTERLEKTLRRRPWIGGATTILVTAIFGRHLFTDGTLIERIGSVLTIIGVGYLAYQLLLIRKRPAGAVRGETDPPASAAFYRAELERQRDFHRGLWFWSRFVIFAPGPLVYSIGHAIAHPERINGIRLNAAAFVALLILAVPMNLWRARKYQREIDALER